MTDRSETTFGVVLRDSRLWRGLTQEQLAAASTVSVRAIRDLETGTTAGPRMQTVELLAHALGLDGPGRDALVRAARRPAPEPAGGLGRPRPEQLPRDVVDFVGRDGLVVSLVDALRPEDRAAVTPVVVVGMGGIGKTALAVRVAHRIRPGYPDGAFFVDLGGAGPNSRPVGDLLIRLLRDLGVPEPQIPADIDERAALLRTVTAGRRLLLLLDNARDAAQVRPLLPGEAACAVIVTSRDHLGGLEGCRRVALDPLPPADARSLLDHIAGAERLGAHPEAAEDLIAGCAGLPLALRIVGARLATRVLDVRELADRLAGSMALNELRVGDLAVRASFETSFAALEEDGVPGAPSAAHALRVLGGWPGDDLDPRAAAAMLATTSPAGERTLERLVDVHLIQSPRPRRYRFHDLIRAYAQERGEADLTAADRGAALTRLLDWYVRTADHAVEMLAPYYRRFPLERIGPALPEPRFADTASAMAWCDAERANVVAAVRAAAEAGSHHRCWMLGTVLFPYWEQRMLWPEFLATHTLALDAARREADRAGEGRALTGLAVARLRTDDPRAAIGLAEQSLVIHTELGDHFRRIGLLDQLARAHFALGEVDTAMALLGTAVDDPHTDPFRLVSCLVTLGIVHRGTGAMDEAVTALERALHIARSAGLPYGEVPALRILGETYLRRGDLDAAERMLTCCIERARDIDSRPHQAEARSLLGEVALARGDAEGATGLLAGALDLMEALGHCGQPATQRLLAEAKGRARAVSPPRPPS